MVMEIKLGSFLRNRADAGQVSWRGLGKEPHKEPGHACELVRLPATRWRSMVGVMSCGCCRLLGDGGAPGLPEAAVCTVKPCPAPSAKAGARMGLTAAAVGAGAVLGAAAAAAPG